MNGNGFGPSPDYMSQIASTFGGAPPAGPVMLGGRPMPPPQPAMAPPLDLGMSVMPPPPALMNLASTPAPMPPPPPSGPPPMAPAARPEPYLRQVATAGSYTAPARETELRGPSLKAAEAHRNAAYEAAVIENNDRAQNAIIDEKLLYQQQADDALARKDVQVQAEAAHAEEMKQRTADFDQSVKALSQQSIDPGRYWSNAGTGTKVAALITSALGGFVQGMKGGSNVGLDMINTAIDRDIKAQEMGYQATRDAMNAKQTAFSMAMQKYGDANQARAAVRAAALDTVQAQMGMQAALWKGTEAANRAQIAMAQLEDEKREQIKQGVAFAPARQVGVAASWVDKDGIHYNEQQVRDLKKEERGQEHDLRKQGEGIAGQIMVEGVKGGAKATEKTDEGARFIAEKLQTAGIPQARAAAERALQALNKNPGGKIEAFDRAVTPDTFANAVHSESANAREQDYNAFKNAAMKAIFGNVTASEESRADKQFGYASDPESRRRAIAAMQGQLEAMEKGIKAGTSPEVQQEYNKRKLNAEGAPPLAPAGAKAR